jgi:ribonuclease T1
VLSIGLPSEPTAKYGTASLASRALGTALIVVTGLLASASVCARNPEVTTGMPVVALAALPVQAQTTYRLILGGGPFPYDKDGTTFFNREKRLPAAARGHYREYTVKTPGLSHRGARRIVCGGKPPTQPEACFYTDDHYASFRLIAR